MKILPKAGSSQFIIPEGQGIYLTFLHDLIKNNYSKIGRV